MNKDNNILAFDEQTGVLSTNLPEGKTNGELLELTKGAVKDLETKFHGKTVKINGRCTVPMALYLGHALAHICAGVEVYDPKLASYVPVISH